MKFILNMSESNKGLFFGGCFFSGLLLLFVFWPLGVFLWISGIAIFIVQIMNENPTTTVYVVFGIVGLISMFFYFPLGIIIWVLGILIFMLSEWQS